MSMQGAAATEAINARWKRRLGLLPILLTLLLINPCESRATYGFGSGPGRRRLLGGDVVQQPESCSGGSFSLTMLHRDHEQSPLRDPQAQNLTFGQRMKEAARRSSERTKSVRHKIQTLVGHAAQVNGSHQRKAQLLGVRSPVFAQQGEYIAHINLGTPAQKFVAILDSGSDLVWVQCKPCNTCISDEPDPLFDLTLSSSYQNLPCANAFCDALPYPSPSCSGNTCPFVYQYGDGTSTSGDLASETITLPLTSGGNTADMPNFAFGCGTDNSGDLAGSDGIIGIGRGPFSLTSQLGSIAGINIFSFCLVNMYDAPTKTSPLMIGKGAFASASGSKWTPIVKNIQSPTFYYVQVDGIKVDGQALPGIPAKTFAIDSVGNGGTIVDTGTTITELLPAAYDVLLTKLTAAVSYPTVNGSDYGFDLCWDCSSVGPNTMPHFPMITLQLRWADFNLPPENAYIEVDMGVICLCFSSGTGVNIIGNTHLQNFQMFVNNDNGVLGWKPAVCDKIPY